MIKIPSSEITPEHVYLSRLDFIKSLGFAGLGALFLSACGNKAAMPNSGGAGATPAGTELKDELGDPATSFDVITNYNNYYEFSLDKEGVAPLAKDFKTSPWTVQVGGLVNNPKTYDIDDLK